VLRIVNDAAIAADDDDDVPRGEVHGGFSTIVQRKAGQGVIESTNADGRTGRQESQSRHVTDQHSQRCMDARTVSAGHCGRSRDSRQGFPLMAERPKRKKPRPIHPVRRLRRKKKRRTGPRPLPPPGDLDLRTLVVLSVGEWWELGDHEWPPERICRWLDKADLRQLRGILLATLDRWHEVRQRETPEP
jgi:hypothetical protein